MFTIRHEFVGVFSVPGKKSNAVTFRFKASALRGSVLSGVALGDKATARTVDDFLRLNDRSQLEIESTIPDESGFSYQFSLVIVRKLRMGNSNWPDNRLFEFAEIEAYRLRSTIDLFRSDTRQATFYLQGPTELWHGYLRREMNEFRTTALIPSKSDMKIAKPTNLTITISPIPKYSEMDSQSEVLAEAQVYGMRVVDTDNDDTSDAEMLNKIMGVVDTLLDCMSFLSQSTVTWFCYRFESKKKMEIVYREIHAVRDTDRHARGFEDNYVLFGEHVSKFLHMAYDKILNYRDQSIDLSLPLRLFTDSYSSPYATTKLLEIFRAIESLIEKFSDSLPRNTKITAKQFDSLSNKMGEYLRDIGFSGDLIASFRKRLPNMFSPALLDSLVGLIRFFNVQIDDIGGEAGLRKSIRMRNKLTHTGKLPDTREIALEASRMHTIGERLILSILGWPDTGNTPTISNRRVMTR